MFLVPSRFIFGRFFNFFFFFSCKFCKLSSITYYIKDLDTETYCTALQLWATSFSGEFCVYWRGLPLKTAHKKASSSFQLFFGKPGKNRQNRKLLARKFCDMEGQNIIRETIPHWREIYPAGGKFCPAWREINSFSSPVLQHAENTK